MFEKGKKSVGTDTRRSRQREDGKLRGEQRQSEWTMSIPRRTDKGSRGERPKRERDRWCFPCRGGEAGLQGGVRCT